MIEDILFNGVVMDDEICCISLVDMDIGMGFELFVMFDCGMFSLDGFG